MTTTSDSALDDAQLSAVAAPPGPVCVLAGAGTGKTRTITHRMARLVASGHHAADEILAVTFTTRAAGEMRTRLRALGAGGVQARTFHSAALRQLRFFWPRSVGGELWPMLDRKMRLVVAAAKHVGASTDTPVLRDLMSEIEWAKASLVPPDAYLATAAALQRDTPVDAQQCARVYEAYESAKLKAKLLDFDDLLLNMCAILETDEDATRTFRARYRCFVVDEYQDVTPLQQRLLDAWLGGRNNLTVVGDANQTIYSFAGASPEYLLQFARRYPDATVVRLERDYRSTPQVVSVANRVIAGSTGENARLRLTLIAALPDGPAVSFEEYPDETAEAASVAQQIKVLVSRGAAPSTIAVLYRINAQSEAYEAALTDVNIPYAVRGSEQFFARADIKAAIAALDQSARAGASSPGLVPLVRATLQPLGLVSTAPSGGAQRERWDALAALLSTAEEMAAGHPAATLSDFVVELRQRAASQHAPAVQGITLASLHAAKGLEWDTVFLVGLADGTLPIQHAVTSDEIEEERRLLYVGVTRAHRRLTLSWALSRHAGGRKSRRPSRFLSGVAPASSRRAPRGRRPSRRCRICGGVLTTAAEVKAARCASCPSTADPALIDALKKWRRQRSAAASVPAFVVVTDATLVAIAERRPADVTALLAIPGIGGSKLDKYGREILDIVAGFGASTDSGGAPEVDPG